MAFFSGVCSIDKSPHMPHISPGWGFRLTSALSFYSPNYFFLLNSMRTIILGKETWINELKLISSKMKWHLTKQ